MENGFLQRKDRMERPGFNGMRLAGSQPYFFPYIGYFQLIHAVDEFILYDHFQYIKGGWIERNRIAMPSGGSKELFIRVPLKKRSSNKWIRDLVIDNSVLWRQKLIKCLRHGYARSPFFDELFPFFEDLVMKEYDLLTDLNSDTIRAVARLLEIRTRIVCASREGLTVEDDLRTANDSCEIKTRRIFLLCRKEKADTFVNATGGQALYSKEEFREQGIRLLFLRTHKYTGSGETKKPVPLLSIVDMLFNCGVDGTKEMLDYYDLI
jgi:hypothetical protein